MTTLQIGRPALTMGALRIGNAGGVRMSGGGASGPSYDADAITLFAAMTTPPDDTRKQLISDTITSLKSAGIWTSLDECWFMAAHDAQAGLLGWKRYKDLTAVNSPTFDVDGGYAGNGTTSYLNTNYVPSTDGVQYTKNDASMGVYSRTNLAANVYDMGSRNATSNRAADIITKYADGHAYFRVNVSVVHADAGAVASSLGLFTQRRTASNAQSAWHNGSQIGSTSSSSSSDVPSYAMYIGATNNANTSTGFTTRQYAFAFVAASMTSQQQADLYTIVQSYMNALWNSLQEEIERLTTSGDYTLTVDGNSLPVEYIQIEGNQVYSTNTDLGDATPDEQMVVVKVKGDLTINSGVTVTTAARKLGLVFYVTGDVQIDGTIDMTARGANHSASGSNITPFNLLVVEGLGADGIIPSAGGAGGEEEMSNSNGNPGVAGASGGMGGGGSGSRVVGGSGGSGAGGTVFTGGSGGGGVRGGDGSGTDNAVIRGGSGGTGWVNSLGEGAGGGAGNPGGARGGSAEGNDGESGTGGLIVIILLGAITVGATGIVRANGKNGGDAYTVGGGGSGGGSINLYRRGAYTNNGTVQANGGSGGIGATAYAGGAGGAGSVRSVAI